MKFHKIILSLLLLNCFSLYAEEYDVLSDKEYPARLVMADYPDCVFDNEENIIFFIFSVLVYSRQTIGASTDCFTMLTMLESSHVIRDDEEVFHFTYWEEPILFALRIDKIGRILTLDFITAEVFALDKINNFCNEYIADRCFEESFNE